MKKHIDIISGGLLVADVMLKPLDKLPAPGTLVYAESLEMHIGGCAANTAVGLARLGAGTALVSRVGADAYGAFLRASLEREGVDCSQLAVSGKTATSATVVFVSADGERSFANVEGTCADVRAGDFGLAAFPAARHLHLGGTLLNRNLGGKSLGALCRAARRAGMSTSIDTVWSPRGDTLSQVEPALPWTDFFFANEREARMMTGRRTPAASARFLLDKGAAAVVIKRGERGCDVYTPAGEFHTPALKVDCVDTTGAGDAFVAGFLFSVLRGDGIRKAAEFGAATAALCVGALGATAGLRGLRETERFMARAKPLTCG